METIPKISSLITYLSLTRSSTKPISLFSLKIPRKTLTPSLCFSSHTTVRSKPNNFDFSFSNNLNPDTRKDFLIDPPPKPENFIEPPYFDEGPEETEEEIAAAYEELYGPAYSGESVLGKDVYCMDSKAKRRGGGGTSLSKNRERIKDGFEDRVVEVRRVSKVRKGGKQLNYRVLSVVGDKKGLVGVGIGKAVNARDALEKSAINARRNIVSVPMTKYKTFPHRCEAKYGAAKVMLRPACPGTGVIAGGAVRIILEMAGVENALGKQLGSNNAINNARATLSAVLQMKQFDDVARERGIPKEELWL
ncbi:hypothetical protein ACFE04_020162 [Oxalis oulophora]